jgi:hypothetical protein
MGRGAPRGAGRVEGARDARSTAWRRAGGRTGTSGGCAGRSAGDRADWRTGHLAAVRPPNPPQRSRPDDLDRRLRSTKDHLACALGRRPSYNATSLAEHNEMLARTGPGDRRFWSFRSGSCRCTARPARPRRAIVCAGRPALGNIANRVGPCRTPVESQVSASRPAVNPPQEASDSRRSLEHEHLDRRFPERACPRCMSKSISTSEIFFTDGPLEEFGAIELVVPE